METESRISYEDMKGIVGAMSEVAGWLVPGMSLSYRENLLQLAHSASGMPPAFSEAEAKMRIALAGKGAFRPACGKIEAFAGEFEGRW